MTNKRVPDIQARKEGKPMAANEEKKITKVEETEKEVKAVILRDEYQNKYTLEFTPRVVKSMERRGFKVDMETPYTCAEELFTGAFQAHHGGKVTAERIKKIWAMQTKKDELLAILVQLYLNPFKELMAEPEGTDENADPTWETV